MPKIIPADTFMKAEWSLKPFMCDLTPLPAGSPRPRFPLAPRSRLLAVPAPVGCRDRAPSERGREAALLRRLLPHPGWLWPGDPALTANNICKHLEMPANSRQAGDTDRDGLQGQKSYNEVGRGWTPERARGKLLEGPSWGHRGTLGTLPRQGQGPWDPWGWGAGGRHSGPQHLARDGVRSAGASSRCLPPPALRLSAGGFWRHICQRPVADAVSLGRLASPVACLEMQQGHR